MKRRRWLGLAGGIGLGSVLSGCVSPSTRTKINVEAVARLGGAGYGIWQNGQFIAGRSLGGRMPSFSITKSLAALAVVDATSKGWIGIDRPLDDIIPEWQNDGGKRRITLRMLVNQTAGFPSGVAALYRGLISDKGRVALSLPLIDPPSSQFRYGPASSEIIAEVLRRVLREHGMTTEIFLRELINRLGISSPNWRKDGLGRFYLSTGAEFNVQGLGRLGQVVAKLATGESFAGLDADVFLNLASPRFPNPMVSAGLWWNRNAPKAGSFAIEPERHLDLSSPSSFWQQACLYPAADPGWLAMVGSGGKRVYILPSRDLVIARLDRAASWDDAAFLRAVVSV